MNTWRIVSSGVAMGYDLAVVGGKVVDGSGRPTFRADVGVKGGKISEVGSIHPDEAGLTIDASGLVVAPGFIDMHSHSARA
jgi:N-acyl-D-aspartate/D-glutamate deacylase